MKRLLVFGMLAVMAGSAGPAQAAFMNFEQFLGFDTAPISTFYSGIKFQSGTGGSDWVARDATTNNYNMSSWPSGTAWNAGNYWVHDFVGATTALDYTGNDGVIAFDNKDATFVELAYCAGQHTLSGCLFCRRRDAGFRQRSGEPSVRQRQWERPGHTAGGRSARPVHQLCRHPRHRQLLGRRQHFDGRQRHYHRVGSGPGSHSARDPRHRPGELAPQTQKPLIDTMMILQGCGLPTAALFFAPIRRQRRRSAVLESKEHEPVSFGVMASVSGRIVLHNRPSAVYHMGRVLR